jgi:uncharacterized protein (DUF885 family)
VNGLINAKLGGAMTAGRWRVVCAGLILAGSFVGPIAARGPQEQAGAQAAPGDSVPSDLRPLLAKPRSEMQLVTTRYTFDRATLNGNYDGGRGAGRGGGRGQGGRGAAPAPEPAAAPSAAPVSMSINRIARLKRFDASWQEALDKLDAGRLSPAAKTELDELKATIQKNLQQLEADAAAMTEVSPVLPFAPALVRLSEARIKLEDVNSQQAAGILTDVTKQVAQIRGSLESGLGSTSTAAGGNGTLRVTRSAATKGAATVDALRASVTTWFNFYNGYDPVFTWWMGMPYKQLDAALEGYAAFLRDKVAAVDAVAPVVIEPAAIAAAPAPKYAEVPDLQEILALPRDEMTDIVQRFTGTGGGRGGRGATSSPGAGRPRQYYVDWLAALKSLDFDALSRNAQVDYLFIKQASERQIARLDFAPEASPPRKTDNSGIPGAARGRSGLILDLSDEMIPYTPEQLIALANREFAWCEEEMKKASRQMGFGDDWKKALEKVKGMHVPPGAQPAMIRGLLFEAIDYLRARDLITVPQIASESLHMSMMSPEAQLSNPFFLGGSQIIVSYPTNTMEYDARLQSMRGNNIPFSHATAFHEMIPGHNLVGYLGSRYAGYRARIGGSTPFFGEGWPLYWELTLYDMGFHDTPEERVGALFWRMHRCARIIFSLMFHMGRWSPQECIDFLVDRVGHERDNATAEVRRSFQGGYSALYQAAYLLGGLQLRGLRKELVDSGTMSNKQFHDEIMRQGSMPIALIRLALTRQKLSRDMTIDWKFYGELPSN